MISSMQAKTPHAAIDRVLKACVAYEQLQLRMHAVRACARVKLKLLQLNSKP